MLPEWIFLTFSAYLCYLATVQEARSVRIKRQGLGSFSEARTTNRPYIDTDESGGINLILNDLNVTSAPAEDNSFGKAETTPVPLTTPSPIKSSTLVPSPNSSKAPPPPTTTFPGYLVGSPYPFALPPPDIPYFGSKWNGPWGYPIGHYQAFRGTGQYINHYQYYPLSYFGSLMAPHRYGLSGK